MKLGTKSFILLCLLNTSMISADDLYTETLKNASISNGFEPIENINSEFNHEMSALGKLFFEDTMLSINSSNSCASCHLDKFSSADGLPNAVGVGGTGEGLERAMTEGKIVPRNTLPLWGRGSKNFKTFFWDGKVTEVDGVVRSQLGVLTEEYINADGRYSLDNTPSFDPLITAIHLPFVEIRELVIDDDSIKQYFKHENEEAALSLYNILVKRVATNDLYVEKIKEIYDIKPEHIEFRHIVEPIAHFVKDKFKIKNTKFHDFVFNNGELTDKEIRGGLIFYGKGSCSSCHSGAMFSDQNFHTVHYNQAGFGKNGFGIDLGRFNVTHNEEDLYKFRTPPLYNVEKSFPYGHSGSVYSLTEAVEAHYNPLKYIDLDSMTDLEKIELFRSMRSSGPEFTNVPHLDDSEIEQLISFLETLSF